MKGSVNERIYRAIKDDLLTGDYTPGARLEAAALADLHHVSVTPVRVALYRLVGEHLVEAQAHEGFHMPRVTEPGLRELLDWNSHLLVTAIRMRDLTADLMPDLKAIQAEASERHVKATERFFSTIAALCGNRHHAAAVARNNDQLRASRMVTERLIPDQQAELNSLVDQLESSDFSSLSKGLLTYHRRRRALVGDMVRLLHQPSQHRPSDRGL